MLKTIYRVFHRHYHTHYHGVYWHAKKLFVIDMGLLAAAVVFLFSGLYFFFWHPGISEWMNLKISFGDGRVLSGEPVRLSVTYENRSKFTIENVTLAVRLPENFIIDRNLTPKTEFSDQSVFQISNLPAGAKGTKEIYGQVWVEPNKTEEVITTLSYNQAGEKNREQKLGSYMINLPGSILEGKLEMATTTFPGNDLQFTLTLQNNGTEPLKVSNSFLGLPVGGISNDEVTRTLLPKEDWEIDGVVYVPNRLPELQAFVTQSKVEIYGKNILQVEKRNEFSVITPQAKLEIKAENNPTFIETKSVLPIKIAWQNNGAYEWDNPELRLSATPGIIDWAATARENHLRATSDGLIINKNSRTALSAGKPGANDTFTINLQMRSQFAVEPGANKLIITPHLSAQINEIKNQNYNFTGNELEFILPTEITLQSEVRYYTDDGDQLGRGPLPPQVGVITKYWVFIRAVNTINSVDNPAFSATLAPGVTPTGKQSVTIGNPIKFSNNSISWNNSSLPANSITGIYFEVAVTPTPEQVGKEIEILKNIRFSATDAVTGKKFNLAAPNLDNLLPIKDAGRASGNKVQR